jgi:hypothetical protein
MDLNSLVFIEDFNENMLKTFIGAPHSSLMGIRIFIFVYLPSKRLYYTLKQLPLHQSIKAAETSDEGQILECSWSEHVP